MSLREARAACCTLLFSWFLLSCTPHSPPSLRTALYLYRFNPPAFVELSSDFQIVEEVPFTIPLNCSLFDTFPAPVGRFLLIELSCPNGQTVLLLDTDTGSVSQPVTRADSHYLGWAGDGGSAFLKVDSLGEAGVIRAYTHGKQDNLHITGWTYDLSARPGSDDFGFAFSRGLGYGSELHAARGSGRTSRLLYEDPFNYLSFSRYSPDGRQIAFIKIPDTQTPFTVGELWVMDADGSRPRKLADVDAGHGYAANWSPDGEWIAFVKRENPGDESADRSPGSLISNIHLVHSESGDVKQVTFFSSGWVETPHWSPDGRLLAFNTVQNGRMDVQIADITSGEIWPLMTDPTCCPAWMRK